MTQRRQAIVQWGFVLFVVVLLLTHASPSNSGLLGWQAIPLPSFLPDWQIGAVVTILPLLVLVGWAIVRHQTSPPRWSWGSPLLTLPMLAFTVLTLAHIIMASQWTTAVALFLWWFIYLFRLNNLAPSSQPPLHWGLLGVIVIQSAVGILQFVYQQDVGLVGLGELTLDTNQIGTSVVVHNGANWLRAYGINSHPNQFGLLLTTLLLIVWPGVWAAQRHLRWATILTVMIGLAGLIVSLSRSAWLALIIGLLVYGWDWRQRHYPSNLPSLSKLRLLPTVFFLAGLLFFSMRYGDTVTGRFFNLDTPLESRSLLERPRDVRLAGQLIAEQPLWGVGLNGYVLAAQALNPEAVIVHNVSLLIGAELGLLGLIAWLLFLLLPLSHLWGGLSARIVPATAVWFAMIFISLVQPEPLLFLIKGAVLWGLAASLWACELIRLPEDRSLLTQ